MIKIAIIGGEGYIGSFLLKNLANEFPDSIIYSYDFGWFSKSDKPVITTSLKHNIYYNGVLINHYNVQNKLICFSRNPIPFNMISVVDVIIWVAGHSSVAMCDLDPHSATGNNCLYFESFLDQYSKTTAKPLLIVASSSSVYGKGSNSLCVESMELPPPASHYDFTMYRREQMLRKYSDINAVVLRLGTVCGAGINHRSELMVNNMVKSALETGKIYYSNPHTRRAILFNRDLYEIVKQIIIQNKINKIEGLHIFNAGTWNLSVGSLAENTKFYMEDNTVELENYTSAESNYSFYLDNLKLNKFIDRKTYSFIMLIDDLEAFYKNPGNAIIGDRNETRKYDFGG